MGGKEIGWFTVDSADEDAVPAGPWLEFHEDRCLLPAGATVLARNDAAVQAFRIGRHFAVQFHPEVDGPQLKRWLDSMGAAAVERPASTPTSSWPTPSARSPPRGPGRTGWSPPRWPSGTASALAIPGMTDTR